MNVIITGTSRGIGLELVKQGLSKGHNILAIARNPEASSELVELKEKNPKLSILKLDLEVEHSEDKILEAVKDWNHVDVLVNNAGIYKEDKSREDFEKSFLVNSIVPLFVTRALAPKLKKSQGPLSLQITSIMGSIKENTSGGSYSYRASKTALNMIYKGLSVDEKWLTSLLVHPGWVQTRMGGEHAPLKVEESASGIWKLIEGAKPSQSGSYLTYGGEILPW